MSDGSVQAQTVEEVARWLWDTYGGYVSLTDPGSLWDELKEDAKRNWRGDAQALIETVSHD